MSPSSDAMSPSHDIISLYHDTMSPSRDVTSPCYHIYISLYHDAMSPRRDAVSPTPGTCAAVVHAHSATHIVVDDNMATVRADLRRRRRCRRHWPPRRFEKAQCEKTSAFLTLLSAR